MTFDLQKILESKREHRRKMAALPIAQKLAMLDVLRTRTIALRGGKTRSFKDALLAAPNVGNDSDFDRRA